MAFSEETKAAALRRAGCRCECTRSTCPQRHVGRCTAQLAGGRWHARPHYRRAVRRIRFAVQLRSALHSLPPGHQNLRCIVRYHFLQHPLQANLPHRC